ncbi:MAG: DUF4352 domain-containing protein [Anaerolineales bacterium]
MSIQQLSKLMVVLLVMLFSTRCTPEAPGPQFSATATEAASASETLETSGEVAPPSPTASPTAVQPTMTPTPSPTASHTPPTPTPSPSAVPPAAAMYGFQVSYTLDAEPDEPGTGPQEGQRWIVVVAAVQNNSDQPVTVMRESLTLIDREGGRYTPDAPDEGTQPPLIGTRLETGEDLLGLVRFTIPEEAQPVTLAWCPSGPAPCDQPLAAPIP